MPTHAPRFSLYVGGRLSYMGFGNAFFQDLNTGNSETTGRLVGNGASFQLDVGARLAKSWIPYLFLEHGLLAKGGYFEGTDAHASTTFYGGGLRHVSGDPDSVAFVRAVAYDETPDNPIAHVAAAFMVNSNNGRKVGANLRTKKS